jgi:hypothetical protein
VDSGQRHVFLYLASGRLFVRREDGLLNEADEWERSYAALLLALDDSGTLDLARGLELLPPNDN